MTAIVIIALVIAVWWYKISADDAKSALINEKTKIYNFKDLIDLLVKSEPGFYAGRIHDNQMIVSKKVSQEFKKSFIVTTSKEGISVVFYIEINYKSDSSHFKFSLYDKASVISDFVVAQSHIFEKGFREKHKLVNA